MADTLATSFAVLNYSGLLFQTDRQVTPLMNALGMKTTNAVKFATSQNYATGKGTQPNVSENASLTAPEASVVTRSQDYNVTQIFHEATGVSYAKQTNMGTLSGLNVAGQSTNPNSELDFQISAKMDKIAKDIEYTLLNGVYAEATDDDTANKTRGFLNACSSTITAASSELKPDLIDELMQKVSTACGSVAGSVLYVTPIGLRQLNKYYSKENGFMTPATRVVGGISINELITPFGNIGVTIHPNLPEGTAVLINLGVSAMVGMNVPNKGNFFYEELAKTGAGIKGQIFGQLGLDYGNKAYHGKITGLSKTYTPKTYGDEVTDNTPSA